MVLYKYCNKKITYHIPAQTSAVILQIICGQLMSNVWICPRRYLRGANWDWTINRSQLAVWQFCNNPSSSQIYNWVSASNHPVSFPTAKEINRQSERCINIISGRPTGLALMYRNCGPLLSQLYFGPVSLCWQVQSSFLEEWIFNGWSCATTWYWRKR